MDAPWRDRSSISNSGAFSNYLLGLSFGPFGGSCRPGSGSAGARPPYRGFAFGGRAGGLLGRGFKFGGTAVRAHQPATPVPLFELHPSEAELALGGFVQLHD